jgi:hypothetical protein
LEEQTSISPARDDGTVDRSIRLFEFLKRVQQVKSTPVRTLDAYEKEGGSLHKFILADGPEPSSLLPRVLP